MTNNITIEKGGITITLDTVEVAENFDNRLLFIRPPQTKQQQDSGPKDAKVIDLLMITHTMVARGYITGTASLTAKQVKGNLITIFKGANTKGGACIVNYAGDNFNMFIEKLIITEKSFDESNTIGIDVAKYDIQITLSEGISI